MISEHQLDEYLHLIRNRPELEARENLRALLAIQRTRGMQAVFQNQDDQARATANAAIARAQEQVRRG